jgi:hypothetical protein
MNSPGPAASVGVTATSSTARKSEVVVKQTVKCKILTSNEISAGQSIKRNIAVQGSALQEVQLHRQTNIFKSL